jgi:hypothetical protein
VNLVSGDQGHLFLFFSRRMPAPKPSISKYTRIQSGGCGIGAQVALFRIHISSLYVFFPPLLPLLFSPSLKQYHFKQLEKFSDLVTFTHFILIPLICHFLSFAPPFPHHLLLHILPCLPQSSNHFKHGLYVPIFEFQSFFIFCITAVFTVNALRVALSEL